MEQSTFHQLLGAAIRNNASDVHFKVGAPPAFRINGALLPIRAPALASDDLSRICGYVLSAARFKGSLDELTEADASYALEGVGRFRTSVFRQKGNLAAILRAISFTVPTFEQLGLPPVLQSIASEERGLVLVTGVTGSGKSSTLAAIVDHINTHQRRHVLTIEDPIEFIHADKSSRITQREVGPDTPSFAAALKAALRQDPDVILLGEMRDLETIETALRAAETGHLVLSTVHTTDAARTVSRLIGAFPAEAQGGVRQRLAESLRAVVSQRLLPHASGKGRVLAVEILVSTLSMREYIKEPGRIDAIKDYLEKSHELYGTQSFDQHLAMLYRAGSITLETAKAAASNPADFERALHFE
ncbi:MAG: type IV pilus twitching motility protein PilT [Deltaproteobacteria bacterium]|nr:type IV pilus twitching motility protein PilT [Deltaproteobacteria bacterium]